jgi:hypothetical protein
LLFGWVGLWALFLLATGVVLMVVEVAVVRLDASFVFAVEWGMGDCVWLIF